MDVPRIHLILRRKAVQCLLQFHIAEDTNPLPQFLDLLVDVRTCVGAVSEECIGIVPNLFKLFLQ